MFLFSDKINQNLPAVQTAACSVELVSGILIVFVIFSLSDVLSFIFAGRGARMRERQPKKEGRRSFVAYLPSLLGFPSRALLFLTLSPLAPRFIRVHVLRGLRDQESGGHSASLRETRRKPKGIGGMRACEFPPVPLGCHPRSVGRSVS